MKPSAKWTLIAGLICTLGAPFVGLFFTVIAMVTAFNTLGQNGISDPKVLAGSVGTALVSTEIGLVIGIIGLPLIVLSLILQFARSRRSS